MIVSNEPGYYKTGEYGIRCENLIMVVPSDRVGDGDYLTFEPLTFAPFDRRLIDASLFSDVEIAWLDAYHQRVFETHAGDLNEAEKAWLQRATAPLVA